MAAAQEERFTRQKHDPGFPKHAVAYCLDAAGIGLSDVDYVAFYDKPHLKFERLIATYLSTAPRGFTSFKTALPVWLSEKLFQKNMVQDALREQDSAFDWKSRLLFSEHHFSHAASAYFPSPFNEAVVLTIDGVGEWATTSVAIGKGKELKIVRELRFPHSLGLLYSAFTYYTGFKVNSGEYKLMGLAPYGRPVYKQLILDRLIDLKPDGTFRLDQQYFDYCTGLKMTNDRFDALFGGVFRRPEDRLIQQHMDIAASIQAVTEEIMLRLTRSLAKEFGIPNLCLAGGVALNCVGNGKLLRDGAFPNIWIQPAAGDAGGALGAALAVYHTHKGFERPPLRGDDAMSGAYLGPSFTNEEIARRLTAEGAVFTTLDDDGLIETAAQALADENIVGWFQGRMEFGPRALGGRSILGDPRSAKMQRILNLKIKYRESFRPFAPSVLAEDVQDWFEMTGPSPYMLLVADVRQDHRRVMTDAENALFGIDKLNVVRSSIPAVTHVDYSARIQTVHEATNPRYHRLIRSFKAKTGCGMVVNTSFNVRGEPIVCTPEDAFRCLMGTEMDILVIGNHLLRKQDQSVSLRLDYKERFELD